MHIDEDMLTAFADGELDGEARAAVERALAADPVLRAQLEAQKRLRATLSAHYRPVASEEVPERLLAMLGAAPAGDEVASLSAARERRRAPTRWSWGNYGAIAATLAVGIIAGQLIPSSGPVGTESGMLVAQGGLANALETQLASAQPVDAATRIGVSFADGEGRLCRTFDGASLSGLACRGEDKWMLVMTTAPTGATASTVYRQAGSSPVLETAQELMAGAPLDAAQERAARDAGWRMD